MAGIDLIESVHHLIIRTEHKPVKQKIRRFSPQRNEIMAVEMNMLLITLPSTIIVAKK